MEATRDRRKVEQTKEELGYYRFLLRHVDERLSTLKPGINTTFNHYADLLEEKRELTRRVNAAIIESYGSDKTYCNPVTFSFVLPLGGTLRTRLRARG